MRKYKILFYDTKSYDRDTFDKIADPSVEITYLENRINLTTAKLAAGYDAVCVFVNDDVNKDVIDLLVANKVKLIVLRSAGFNNVDIKYAYKKIHVARVPAYSPYAVAEYTMALLLTLVRKTHKAYIRTKDHNFALKGLTGFDLYNKTIGIIGTGKIGRVLIDICLGFKMKVLAYDLYPYQDERIKFVDLETLYQQSHIISLHAPLTNETKHMINDRSLKQMKTGVIIINTSRGALIDSNALLNAIRAKKLGGVALDVYEEESDYFYEDLSYEILDDEILTQLIAMPNVLLTSHQAFLTREALDNIAKTTIDNVKEYFTSDTLTNEVCYRCDVLGKCNKNDKCF